MFKSMKRLTTSSLSISSMDEIDLMINVLDKIEGAVVAMCATSLFGCILNGMIYFGVVSNTDTIDSTITAVVAAVCAAGCSAIFGLRAEVLLFTSAKHATPYIGDRGMHR